MEELADMNMFKNLADKEKVRRSSAEVVNHGQAAHGVEYWILTESLPPDAAELPGAIP